MNILYSKMVTSVKYAGVFGIAHHIDHIIRKEYGWPFESEVTPFTYSLLIYPLILLGIYLESRKPGGYFWYWMVISLFGSIIVIMAHFLPDSPDKLLALPSAYANPLAGGLAFLILAGLILSLVLSFIFALRIVLKKRT